MTIGTIANVDLVRDPQNPQKYVDSNSDTNPLTIIAHNNYEFVGWTTTWNGEERTYQSLIDEHLPNFNAGAGSDLSFTAKYVSLLRDVIFEDADGITLDGDDADVTHNVNANDVLMASPTVAEDATHKFVEWQIEDLQLVGDAIPRTYTYDDLKDMTNIRDIRDGGEYRDLVFKPVVLEKSIVISFTTDGNGTIDPSGAAANQYAIPNESLEYSGVVMPTPTPNPGFEFDKWVDDIGEEVTPDSFYPGSDVTVKAVFKPVAATVVQVSFVAEGNGSLDPAVGPQDAAVGVVLPNNNGFVIPNPVAEDGYEFLEWLDGDDNVVDPEAYEPQADVTLRATFTDITRTVTYKDVVGIKVDGNDADKVYTGVSVNYTLLFDDDDEQAPAPDVTVEPGYEFLGWQTIIDGVPKTYDELKNEVRIKDNGEYNDLVFEPIVEPLGNVTVTFTPGAHGNTIDTETYEFSIDQVQTLEEQVDQPLVESEFGYTFSHYETSAGQTFSDLAGQVINEDTEFIAQYVPMPTVLVQFVADDNGGLVPDVQPQNAVVGEALPNNPSFIIPNPQPETGYVFDKWVVEGDDEQNAVDPTTYVPTDDVTLVAKFIDETVTVTFDIGDNGEPVNGSTLIVYPEISVNDNLDTQIDPVPTVEGKPGYVFIGWKTEDGSPYDAISNGTIDQDLTLYAQYEGALTVKFEKGDHGVLQGVTEYAVSSSDSMANQGVITPLVYSYADYEFIGWSPEFNGTETIFEDRTYVAQYRYVEPTNDDNDVDIDEDETPQGQLEKGNHYAYIQGYPDGNVRPGRALTREEVATIFFRLLENDYREDIRSYTNSFSDVAMNRWSNKHISTLANGNIITGYEDGTFRPHAKITRAELAKIASKFDNLADSFDHSYTDISGHWAEKYIASALNKGWIDWNRSGRFYPDKPVSRAEFVSFVNNVLDRHVTVEDVLPDSRSFHDLQDTSAWYYCPMKAATNSYDYEIEIPADDSNNGDDGIIDDGETPLGDGRTYQKWTKIIYPEIEM